MGSEDVELVEVGVGAEVNIIRLAWSGMREWVTHLGLALESA